MRTEKKRGKSNGPIARTVGELKNILLKMPDDFPVKTEFGDLIEVVCYVGSMGVGVQFIEYREDEE